MLRRLINSTKRTSRIVFSAAHRFYWDDCFSRASSLAYTTLFALVPISVIVFQLLPALGLDQIQMASALNSVLEQVLPDVEDTSGIAGPHIANGASRIHESDLLMARPQSPESSSAASPAGSANGNPQKTSLKKVVYENLLSFTENVRALNTVSVIILLVTGIALLNTIESALNVVWRVTTSRSLLSKIITFWAVITFGPMLLAVSFYWQARVWALTESSPFIHTALFALWDFVLPVSLTWAVLVLLYSKVPSTNVKIMDAAFGALVGAVLFQFVKKGFAFYMSLSTTYSIVYGAFMTVPVFLFWLYIAWVVVLYGAEVAHQSGSIEIQRGLRKYATELGEIGGILGLRILCVIGRSFVEGKLAPSESEIAIETGSDPVLVRTCLEVMTEANLLTVADEQTRARTLARTPDKLKVEEVLRTFLSKEHVRKDNRQTDDDNSFLDLIRRKSLTRKDGQTIRSWTLSELLAGENNASLS